MIETLLSKFEENNIPIQITLDIDKNPTVHAITKEGVVKTEHEILFVALELMEEKLFE